jgi:hypothetical protein
MWSAIIAIIGAIFKGLFSVIADSSESSAQSEVESLKGQLESLEEAHETEKEIHKNIEEVADVQLDPEDLFGASTYTGDPII